MQSAITATGGHTAATAMTARLLEQYAWSDRTGLSRHSQWRAWLAFCDCDNRPVLPVTEAHLLSFVGWLGAEREAGRRSVGSASIPQYLSAVRQMQLLLTGTPVPPYPMMVHVLRGYRRWEEQNFPQQVVRCGIPASLLQRICHLGLTTDTQSLLRDSAMCVLSYVMNGLRESSVASLRTALTEISLDAVTVRLSVVKGRAASTVPLIRYYRLPGLSSPLDVILRWHRISLAARMIVSLGYQVKAPIGVRDT